MGPKIHQKQESDFITILILSFYMNIKERKEIQQTLKQVHVCTENLSRNENIIF